MVDNGSTDGSAQLDADFPNVQFIRLPKNFGLTKALNLGWRAADAEYVLFLHDDTEVEPSTVGAWPTRWTPTPTPPPFARCWWTIRPAARAATGQPAAHRRVARRRPGAQPFAVEFPRGAALMVRVFFIKAIRQIDERYGQFGSDADLAAEIRRASRKILLVPAARVRHRGTRSYSALERADFLSGRAVFMGKYLGFAAGLRARMAAVLGPLFGFRLGELVHHPGQKIDGTQE